MGWGSSFSRSFLPPPQKVLVHGGGAGGRGSGWGSSFSLLPLVLPSLSPFPPLSLLCPSLCVLRVLCGKSSPSVPSHNFRQLSQQAQIHTHHLATPAVIVAVMR